MFAGHCGLRQFLEGVSLYLKRHLYSIATSLDLWKAISETTGVDFVDLTREWFKTVRQYLLL
jgi:aminopeptidase 2